MIAPVRMPLLRLRLRRSVLLAGRRIDYHGAAPWSIVGIIARSSAGSAAGGRSVPGFACPGPPTRRLARGPGFAAPGSAPPPLSLCGLRPRFAPGPPPLLVVPMLSLRSFRA